MTNRSLLLSSQVYANLCEETGTLDEVRAQEIAELQTRLEKVQDILVKKAQALLRMGANMCDCEDLVRETKAFESNVINGFAEMDADPETIVAEEALDSGFASAIEKPVRDARSRQIEERYGKPARQAKYTTIAQYQAEQRQLELELDMLKRLKTNQPND